MQNNSSKVAVVIIVLAVLAAIYLYFGQSSAPRTGETNTPSGQTSNSAFNFLPLTLDETAALSFPKSGASADTVLAHAGAVHKAAKASEVVAVGASCRTSPVSLSLQKGKRITFRNYDSVDHTLSFDAQHFVLVPAGQTVSMDMSFGEIEHIYGYGCEANSSPVGVVLVVR